MVTKSIGVKPSLGQKLSLSHSSLSKDTLILTDPWSTHTFEQWCGTQLPIAKEGGVPVIMSLQAVTDTAADDIRHMAAKAQEAGADAIELSAFGSSPNVVRGLGIGAVQSPQRTYDVTRAAKSEVSIPVITKLLPEPSNLEDLVKAAEDGGAAAIASRDTIFPAISFDIYTRQPKVARNIGTWMPELSGRSIKENALGYVAEICRRTQLPVIGIGGVATWEDAVEMIVAGATAVGLCTAAMTKGPDIFRRLVQGLSSYLVQEKMALEELRASGLAGMERVNQLALRDFTVVVEAQECTNCGACQRVCQVQAPQPQAEVFWIDPQICIRCGMCLHYCPVNCIGIQE